MLDFMAMEDDREERKILRYETENLVIDTCAVSDGAKPYETAVSDVRYNPGEWAIVEAYDTYEDAEAGHDRWLKTMLSDNPPEGLVSIPNAEIQQYAESQGIEYRFPRIKEATETDSADNIGS